MTIQAAFIAELDEVSVSESTVEKTLLDRGLDGTALYTASEDQKKAIDLCVIDALYRLYNRADIREGDFQKSHPDFLRKLEARLLYLAKKHSVTEVLQVLETPVPTIKNGTARW